MVGIGAFYLVFTLGLGVLLLGRNWLSHRSVTDWWWGIVLSAYSAAIIAFVFAGMVTHYPLVEGDIARLGRGLLGGLLAFLPIIWAGVVAALFNRFFGR
jgi:hypothetical protein